MSARKVPDETQQPSDRLPLIAFCVSLVLFGFLAGVVVGHEEIFPYKFMRDAGKTLSSLKTHVTRESTPLHGFVGFSDAPLNALQSSRVRGMEADGADGATFLLFGGALQYLELCPEFGCAAVHVTANGDVVHAYPYRPYEIFAADVTANDFPHESLGFDPLRDMRPVSARMLEGGDLLVIFSRTLEAPVFPFGTGVARVDPQGHPRWYRFDYSHHWPSPAQSEQLLIPSVRLIDGGVAFEWRPGDRYRLACSSKTYDDTVQVLSGDGGVSAEISMLQALIDSPYRGVLEQTTDDCDPLHLNFIDVIRDDGLSSQGLAEQGDWVVSFRNLSAFGIVDPQTHRLKHLVRGSFFQQHSVQHISGSRFLIFDNKGGDWRGGPSRVLELDLAGGRERTIFPTSAHEVDQRALFQKAIGHLSISPDRSRAIAAFTGYGVAYELELADGRVLREFNSLHDLSTVEKLPSVKADRAAIFELFGVEYVTVPESGGEGMASDNAAGGDSERHDRLRVP